MGGWEPHTPCAAPHETPSPGSPQETAAAIIFSQPLPQNPSESVIFPLQSQRVNTSDFMGHVVAVTTTACGCVNRATNNM